MMSLKFLRPLFVLIITIAMLAGCSELLFPPTPTATPIPRFGTEELRNVFENLPEGYVEVGPHSRELGSASFNDAFDSQLAFWNSTTGRLHGFSVSLGILPPGDEEAFDYALEKQWGTADADLIRTDNFDRAIGVFWIDIGDNALGIRLLELPVRRKTELMESIVFRREKVAVVVKFAQPVAPTNPLASGVRTVTSENYSQIVREQNCGGAYICFDIEPDFVTGIRAATMIDEAIVRFYGGLTDDVDK